MHGDLGAGIAADVEASNVADAGDGLARAA